MYLDRGGHVIPIYSLSGCISVAFALYNFDTGAISSRAMVIHVAIGVWLDESGMRG